MPRQRCGKKKTGRRQFLGQVSVAAAASLGLGGLQRSSFAGPDAQGTKGNMNNKAFRHRVAFGVWINDMRDTPLPKERWPAMTFDDRTEQGILATLKLQARAGFNVFDIFGFFAAYSWPLDIASGVAPDRLARARRLIDAAHALGLKVIHGTGVYSWGFDEIIKANPGIQGTNHHAMCASSEESWAWMKKVLDFVLDKFNLDGFHLEASDQGRCTCPKCQRWGDVEYYSILNARAADYIRSRAPDKLLLVSMCGYMEWGKRMDPAEYRHLVELSRHVDIIIEPGHAYQYFTNPADWPTLIPALHCALGTSGHIWVYPPQHWERLRWFLPYTQRTGRHLADFRRIGGNACEYYMGPVANPSVEVNIAFGGQFMQDASRPPAEVLEAVVADIYHTTSKAAAQDLAQVFIQAEDAFFSNCLYNVSFRQGCMKRPSGMW